MSTQAGSSDILKLYFQEIKAIDLLNEEEERSLAASGAPKDKKKLIESNLRLVVSIANKYKTDTLDLLDLIQEGNIGLVKAAEKYDLDHGSRFATYAAYYIKSEIQRAIINQGRSIRIPEHMIQQMKRMGKIREELQEKLGRYPTSEEVARKMKITVKEVDEMRLLQQPIKSTDSPLSNDEDKDITLQDVIPDPNPLPIDRIIDEALGDQLQDALDLDILNDREKRILMLRYGTEDEIKHTYKEIGSLIGLSPERIRRIEKEAIRKLNKSPKIRKIFGK